MKEMPVSILVPVYQVEKFIERCTRSLLEQSFPDLEYIFVDDGSPDNSIPILEQIIAEYPERQPHIQLIRHTKNKGIAEVRNTLVEHARGEYLLFVDSDDWIEKNTVELLYHQAKKENADIVGCDFYIKEKDREYPVHENYAEEPFQQLKQIISLRTKAYLWKLLIKRSLFSQHRIHFPTEIQIGEDDIVCVQLYYFAKKISSIPVALYHYVQYNPTRYTQASLKNIEQFLQAAQLIGQFCREQKIYPQIKEELYGRIFITKNRLLSDPHLRDYRKWASIFPETNKSWRQYRFPADQKFIYWLAERHAFGCIRLLKSLKKLFRH